LKKKGGKEGKGGPMPFHLPFSGPAPGRKKPSLTILQGLPVRKRKKGEREERKKRRPTSRIYLLVPALRWPGTVTGEKMGKGIEKKKSLLFKLGS